MKLTKTLLALNICLLSSACAFAATNIDAQIIENIIQVDQNEINAAKLAQDKASSQQVKEFANWMSEAHSKHLTEMQDLGQKINVSPEKNKISKSLEKEGQHEIAKLSSLEGNKFDQDFMKAMVKDHTEALKLIKKDLSKAQNPELKSLLKATETHVESHLNKAKEIKKQMG